jgi:hypothetical protein
MRMCIVVPGLIQLRHLVAINTCINYIGYIRNHWTCGTMIDDLFIINDSDNSPLITHVPCNCCIVDLLLCDDHDGQCTDGTSELVPDVH